MNRTISCLFILSCAAFAACESDADLICAGSTCSDTDILVECVGGVPKSRSCKALNRVCSEGECVERENAPYCEENACKDDDILIKCTDNVPSQISCRNAGSDPDGYEMMCIEGSCDVAPCTKSVCRDENTLIACESGQRRKISCKSGDLVCDPDLGECTEPECRESECRGDVRYRCEDGHFVAEDCALSGMICLDSDCIKPEKCEAGDIAFCDATALIECSADLTMTRTECSDENKICDGVQKKCVYACESSEQNRCHDAQTLEVCDDHHWTKTPCGAGQICRNGACERDPCSACSPDETCHAGECIANALHLETDVGMPCRCEGSDCNTIVTNRQVKSYLTTVAILAGAQFLSELKDDDYAVIPNFFSQNAVGCESLYAAIPEGMAVGCMRTATFSIAQSQATFLTDSVPGILAMIGKESNFLSQKLPKIAQKLYEGVEVSAPNGYCFYGALDITAQLTNKLFKMLFIGSAFDREKGLFSKILAGNHETAVAAAAKAAESGTGYCPKGSEFLSYEMKKESASFGKAAVALDLCLKSCETADDCRKGYDCYDMPDGLPASGLNMAGQPRKKICIDKANIDMLKALRTELTESESAEQANAGN